MHRYVYPSVIYIRGGGGFKREENLNIPKPGNMVKYNL